MLYHYFFPFIVNLNLWSLFYYVFNLHYYNPSLKVSTKNTINISIPICTRIYISFMIIPCLMPKTLFRYDESSLESYWISNSSIEVAKSLGWCYARQIIGPYYFPYLCNIILLWSDPISIHYLWGLQ